MSNIRHLTCIVCPMGCQLAVSQEEDGSLSVTGNSCPRGIPYAISECTAPTRMLTTTVRCNDRSVLAVRTDRPISKEIMFDAMRAINRYTLTHSVAFGDVLIPNLLGSGANLIACGIKILD